MATERSPRGKASLRPHGTLDVAFSQGPLDVGGDAGVCKAVLEAAHQAHQRRQPVGCLCSTWTRPFVKGRVLSGSGVGASVGWSRMTIDFEFKTWLFDSYFLSQFLHLNTSWGMVTNACSLFFIYF